MRRMTSLRPNGIIPGGALSYSLTLLLTCFGMFAQSQVPINPIVPKALYLIETEQMKKALADLEQAIGANPTDAALHYYLGYAFLKANERSRALAAFEKGIQTNDKELLNYAGKGWVSLLEGKVDDARLQFEKAGVAKSRNAEVLKAVAEAYLIDNKYSVDAMTVLNRAKSAASSDPEVQLLFGDAYLLQNNGGLSVTSYERAATLRPTMAKPYYKIGLVYERSKNNELALENFTKATTIDPRYTLAYKELGEVYYLMNNAEKALKAYEMYLSLTEKPEAGQLQLAFILSLGKDYKRANEVFKKIADAPDVKVVTLRFYANSLYEAGDFTKSREVFEKYFSKAKPEDLVAKDFEDYGKALLKLKQDSLGVIALQKSLSINPEQQEILQLVGDTYFKNKKFPQAIEAYKKLMSKRKDPKSLDFFSIGRSYYFNNQFVEADSAFSKLISMQPEMTVGYIWEANTKAQMDPESEQGLAKPYFEKVLEKGSTNPEKNKKDLINAYKYLAYYSYLKKDYTTAKANYEKWLTLAPGDKDAQDALDILNKPAPQQPQPKK
ncbi:MAG TPA: tetratricopeptide repeat protein [Cyclobacteriaceae bacterium]|nr:tetratricopeptide repeat protein [Cyclobacteriaceae bacterium]